MTAAGLTTAKGKIDTIVGAYQAAAGIPVLSVLSKLTAGKVYEGWILCHVLEHFSSDEGFDVAMVGSSKVYLKSSPGPINAAYPHFEITRGSERYDVWTDVEFLALSHWSRGAPPPTRGDHHELDIIVVPHGVTDRPRHDQVIVGVECKNTPYTKDLLRAILGVRRELSFYRSLANPTPFDVWPRPFVTAEPPSCLLVYSTSAAVLEFAAPGTTFGIDFHHEGLP